MRPRLLWLLAAAHASKYPDPPTDAVDAYVRSWAAGGTARRCGDVGAHGDCSWMSGFGPIDVACTIHIDRVGLLDDTRGPALTWVFLNVGASSLLQRADAAACSLHGRLMTRTPAYNARYTLPKVLFGCKTRAQCSKGGDRTELALIA